MAKGYSARNGFGGSAGMMRQQQQMQQKLAKMQQEMESAQKNVEESSFTASVGGGAIRVERLDGIRVSFTGENNTLVITHTDAPGVIAQVSSLLAGQGVNIATMQVFRTVPGGDAVMVIESDELPTCSALECLRGLRAVNSVTMLQRLDR